MPLVWAAQAPSGYDAEAILPRRMRVAIPAFLEHLAAHRSPRTCRTYGAILASFVKFLEGIHGTSHQAPTRSDIEGFLGRPRSDGARAAPTTRNQELAALRAFAKFAVREGVWTTDPTGMVPFLREPPRDPPVLTAGEVRQLFETAARISRPELRERDLAILVVLSQVGLRVHELVGLDVGQADLATGTLLGVRGKGGTVHDLPLNAPAIALLAAWLAVWLAVRPKHAADGESALFVSSRGTRLSIRAVERLFVILRKAMGTGKKITPHSLRHTMATLALTLGTDLATVGDLLRHSDLNTTRKYLHLVDTRRREAVGRLAMTVPKELLPSGTSSNPPQQELPMHTVRDSSETPSDSSRKPLDAQYGLGAPCPLCPWRSPPRMTTNTTRARMGACCVPAAPARCRRSRVRCDGRD